MFVFLSGRLVDLGNSKKHTILHLHGCCWLHFVLFCWLRKDIFPSFFKRSVVYWLWLIDLKLARWQSMMLHLLKCSVGSPELQDYHYLFSLEREYRHACVSVGVVSLLTANIETCVWVNHEFSHVSSWYSPRNFILLICIYTYYCDKKTTFILIRLVVFYWIPFSCYIRCTGISFISSWWKQIVFLATRRVCSANILATFKCSWTIHENTCEFDQLLLLLFLHVP